jgi:hypothetical protein
VHEIGVTGEKLAAIRSCETLRLSLVAEFLDLETGRVLLLQEETGAPYERPKAHSGAALQPGSLSPLATDRGSVTR